MSGSCSLARTGVIWNNAPISTCDRVRIQTGDVFGTRRRPILGSVHIVLERSILGPFLGGEKNVCDFSI